MTEQSTVNLEVNESKKSVNMNALTIGAIIVYALLAINMYGLASMPENILNFSIILANIYAVIEGIVIGIFIFVYLLLGYLIDNLDKVDVDKWKNVETIENSLRQRKFPWKSWLLLGLCVLVGGYFTAICLLISLLLAGAFYDKTKILVDYINTKVKENNINE